MAASSNERSVILSNDPRLAQRALQFGATPFGHSDDIRSLFNRNLLFLHNHRRPTSPDHHLARHPSRHKERASRLKNMGKFVETPEH